ncbi:hypothetical protein DSCW_51090 [Desulfosarcina widdelii]|uniref:Uncharacterized protein n=1 Tax=Desulfosarcina widdelii TaxID=947919 RepID=A0A5K7Z6Q7_9BACT|nr:HTH domain-containing protein [Desulfosarcina widdelii]BBO77692.1 hypothetical protein DSCW_51090 [Desulfosarcina widdelii]
MRKMLGTQDYVTIAREWSSKSIEQLADELGVSQNTIRKAAQKLREKDPSKCAKAKRRTRDDIAEEAIRILNGQAA